MDPVVYRVKVFARNVRDVGLNSTWFQFFSAKLKCLLDLDLDLIYF